MEFKIFSKQDIEKYTSNDPYAVISIAGKHPAGINEFADLLPDPNRKCLLQITFDDVTASEDWDGNIDPDIIAFNKSHADKIEEFMCEVDTYNQSPDPGNQFVTEICINCYAGISRSSAVASALSIIENGNGSDKWIWDSSRYFPNSLVYRTILERYSGIIGRGNIEGDKRSLVEHDKDEIEKRYREVYPQDF